MNEYKISNRILTISCCFLLVLISLPVIYDSLAVHRVSMPSSEITNLVNKYKNEIKKNTKKSENRHQITITRISTNQLCDIEPFVATYLDPFLNQIDPLFEDLIVNTNDVYSDKVYDFSTNDKLSFFVNSIDNYNLLNYNPLNFIIYHSPTPVDSASFFIKDYGGLFIENSNNTVCDYKPFFELIVTQLRTLLSIQKLDKTTQEITESDLKDTFKKLSIRNIVNSVKTLNSLVALIENIQNMVVKENIAYLVKESIVNINLSSTLLESNYKDAHLYSLKAISLAEQAFFDPSMVSMLYFPTEHFYAVCLPFFLPTLLPIVASIFKEFKLYRKQFLK